MDNNTELFETMPAGKALARLAVPTIISQLITMIYNLADTFFVGQTNDPLKVAAVSVAGVLFFLLTAWANLFGIGGGSLMSQLLGQKNEKGAKEICAASMYGTIIISGIYALLCFVLRKPLLGLVGATENTIDYAASYTLFAIVIGGIPATMCMGMSHLLRNAGYAKQAGFGVGMGGVLNIVLDPLFMFVILPEGNEVTGAAIATMLSNIIAMIYCATVFFRLRKKSILSFSPHRAMCGFRQLWKILMIGLPSAVSSFLVSITIMITNGLYATYSDTAVAANGIFKKLEMLPLNVSVGLCQGLIPLVAYNYSSGNHKRMTDAIRCARNAGIIFNLICLAVFEVFANQIAGLFIDEPETVKLAANFVRIGFLITPVLFYNKKICYTFQAMGNGGKSLLVTLCREGIFNIPVLFLMNACFGMYGIAWTQIVADGITLIISVFLYHDFVKKLKMP